MDVAIAGRWADWIEAKLADGRFASASDLVHEALRLLEERELALTDLREAIQISIAGGGEHTSEDVLGHVRHGFEKRRQACEAA